MLDVPPTTARRRKRNQLCSQTHGDENGYNVRRELRSFGWAIFNDSRFERCLL